ncbi:MAG: hypothetical protein ACR2PL_22145 [Dehalococcoidia bacterium]
MEYTDWNQRIAEHFFCSEMAGKPVYLRVDPDELGIIAQLGDLDEARTDFCRAVRTAVKGDGSLSIFNTREVLYSWTYLGQKRGAQIPPFVALLAASVLAGFDMANDPQANIPASAYYKRLNEILQIPHITPGGKTFLVKCWKQLNRWLNIDQGGARGRSTACPFQRYANIGYPLSQCTLRREDRLRLPLFFRWAGLEPGEIVDEDQLFRDFTDWIHRKHCPLTKGTTELLRELFRKEQAQAAFQDLKFEYERWDGTFPEHGGSHWAPIQLQLRVLRERHRFALQFVARRPEGFPVGEFTVTGGGDKAQVTITSSEPGYYDTLGFSVTGAHLGSGVALARDSVRLLFSSQAVYTLEQDTSFGEWVTRDQPSLGEHCIILVANEGIPTVQHLLQANARAGWHRLPAGDPSNGLPHGWTGFCCVEFLSVFDAPAGYEAVEPRRRFEVHLQGGLKFTSGCWMVGALPKLSVWAETSSMVTVLLDGKVIDSMRPPFALDLNQFAVNVGEHELRIANRTLWFRVTNEVPADGRQPDNAIGWELDSNGGPLTSSFPTPDVAGVAALFGAFLNGAAKKMVEKRHIAVYPGHMRIAWIGPKAGQISWLRERPLLEQVNESTVHLRIPQDFTPAWLWMEARGKQFMFPHDPDHVEPPQPVVAPMLRRPQMVRVPLEQLKARLEASKGTHPPMDTTATEPALEWAGMIANAQLMPACCHHAGPACELRLAEYRTAAAVLLKESQR